MSITKDFMSRIWSNRNLGDSIKLHNQRIRKHEYQTLHAPLVFLPQLMSVRPINKYLTLKKTFSSSFYRLGRKY